MCWWLLLASAQSLFPPDPLEAGGELFKQIKVKLSCCSTAPALCDRVMAPPGSSTHLRQPLSARKEGGGKLRNGKTPHFKSTLVSSLGKQMLPWESAPCHASVHRALLLVAGFCPGTCVMFLGNLNLVSHMFGHRLFSGSMLPDCLCEQVLSLGFVVSQPWGL